MFKKNYNLKKVPIQNLLINYFIIFWFIDFYTFLLNNIINKILCRKLFNFIIKNLY